MFCCFNPTAVSPSPAPQPASKIKTSVVQTDFTKEQRKTLEVALATTKVAARAKMYELNQVECSAVDRPAVEEQSVFFTMDQRDALEKALAATKIKTYEKSKPLAKDERLDFDIDQEIRENGSVIHNEVHSLAKYITRKKLYYKGMAQENYLIALEQYGYFLPKFARSMLSDIKIFNR